MKWQVKKLGELCEIEWKRGSGLRKSDLDENGENQCILYGELYTKHKNVLIENNNISRTNKIGKVFSKKGDILVPGTSTAAKQDMLLAREIDEDGVFLGGDINIIRPKQGIFAQKYLPYFFETETAFDQLDRYITGATGIIHISNTGLKQLNIPLPPLAEQKRIVAILDQAFSEVEKVKANTEQNLKNAKELFQSYLQGVFENKGDDWEEKKLGEVCETGAGGTPLKTHKDYYEGGRIPWLLSGEVSQGEIFDAKHYITEKGLKNSSAKMFPKDTVLIAMYGATAGQVGILRFESSTNQAICGILPNKNFLPEFLYYKFLAGKDLLVSQAVGGAQPNISQIKIKNTLIPIMPLTEQKAIVQRLDALRAETQRLESIYRDKLLSLEELKKSILQKAFSGELRG